MSSNNKRNNGSSGDAANPNEPKAKKAKTSSAADILICPITRELPIDPVTTEDGQHYEREAIEKHIKTQQENGQELRSPVANTAITPTLHPAHTIKNMIERAVEAGEISGELADSWKERMKEKKELEKKKAMEKLIKKAEDGDLVAIYNLADNYLEGDYGFQQDYKLAHKWFTKGHDAGDEDATAGLGHLLIRNHESKIANLPEHVHDGVLYLMSAAKAGSNWAAQLLGFLYADGAYGYTVNKKEAIKWLKQSLVLDGIMRESGKKAARQKLIELTGSRAVLEEIAASNGSSD